MKIAYIIMQFFFPNQFLREANVSVRVILSSQRKFTTENWFKKIGKVKQPRD